MSLVICLSLSHPCEYTKLVSEIDKEWVYMYRKEFDKFGNQTSLCFTVKVIDGENECEHEIESSCQRHTSLDGDNECKHEIESSCQRHTSFDGVNECEHELESSCEKHNEYKNHASTRYQPSKRKCPRRKRNKKHRHCRG